MCRCTCTWLEKM